MDWLKKLLGDEDFAKLEASEIYKSVEGKLKDAKLIVDDGQLIPKHRLDEVIEKNKFLQSQVEQSEKDVKDIKRKAAGNDELVKELETIQNNAKEREKTFEQRETDLKKSFAVIKALLDAGVYDPVARDLLAKQFPPESIELDKDGSVKGFEELVKPLKESNSLKGMFGTKSTEGTGHKDGDKQYTKPNPFKKESLNIAEQVRLKKENPAEYERLKQLV